MRARLSVAVALVFAVPAGADAPGLSQRERAIGAEANPEIVRTYGGIYSGPQVAYVTRVGQRIAVQANPDARPSDYTVTVLNTSVPNAFALPGGYIYVTRGLLTLLNSEAELAGVLGHEVGHVAARHSQKRETRSTIGSLLGTIAGAVTKSDLASVLVSRGAQVYTLGFSRSQEYQADQLGVRYLASAGYDPFAMSNALVSLEMQDALDARVQGQAHGAGVPSFLRTHPPTPDRVERARNEATQASVPTAARRSGYDAYLNAIDGLPYEDGASAGKIEGSTYRDTGLGVAFTAPSGFTFEDRGNVVLMKDAGGAIAEFTAIGVQPGASLADAAQSALRQVANADGTVRPSDVNGIESAVASTRGVVNGVEADVAVAVYRPKPAQTFAFVTVAPAGQAVFGSLYGSLRRVSSGDKAGPHVRRIQVVVVRPGDRVSTLAPRMAFETFREERFRTLNRLSDDEDVRPGDRVKLVVR